MMQKMRSASLSSKKKAKNTVKATRLSHICGKLYKKVWISAGDIVLVCVRDYQDTKADVVHRYYHHEARSLKAYGELPECIRPGGLDDGDDDGDDCVEFAEGEDFVLIVCSFVLDYTLCFFFERRFY
ncbi:eukaryotic translation initiation factor 1A [Tanacetum coccineum]